MIDNRIKAEWTNADALDLQPTYNQLATDCTKCNEYDNEEKTCPHYCEVRRSTEDGLQVEAYCKKTQHSEEDATSDCISRQAVTDTVRTIILGFFSDEDGAMTDTEKTLLRVNKAICDGVRALPSAQPEIIRCKDCKYYTPVTAHCEIRGKGLYLIRGMEDFCSRAERRTDERSD